MSNTSMLVPVAGALIVGAAVGWFIGSPGKDAAPADGDAAATEQAAATAAAAEADQEAARLERELTKERRHATQLADEKAKLAAELETAKSALAAAEELAAVSAAAEAPADWKARAAKGPMFEFPEYADSLKEIDWVMVGDNTAKMMEAIEPLAKELSEGKQPSAELIGKTQQYNGGLVTVAVTLDRGNVPGDSPNQAFTHPSVMANSMGYTLAAAGLPLDATQEASLGALAARFDAEGAQREKGYDDRVTKMRKLSDEALHKRAFFDEAFALLTPEQSQTLRPDLVRGRLRLDLYCEGLIWVSFGTTPVQFTERADIVTRVQELVASPRLALPTEFHEEARALVSQWANGLPAEVDDQKLDALGRMNMVPASMITLGAQETARLFELFLDNMSLPAETADSLRQAQRPLVMFTDPGT